MQSSFCLYLMHHENENEGLKKRGPERRHRTFEPRPTLENKKERCFMHHSFLFISARRGSNPRPPPWQGGAPPLSHSRMSYRQVIIYYRVF